MNDYRHSIATKLLQCVAYIAKHPFGFLNGEDATSRKVDPNDDSMIIWIPHTQIRQAFIQPRVDLRHDGAHCLRGLAREDSEVVAHILLDACPCPRMLLLH